MVKKVKQNCDFFVYYCIVQLLQYSVTLELRGLLNDVYVWVCSTELLISMVCSDMEKEG